MANWYGSARTNYVALAQGVSLEDLMARLQLLDVELDVWTQEQGGVQRVGFGPPDSSDDGAFPGFLCLDLEEDDPAVEALMKIFGYDDRDAFLEAAGSDELEFEWDKVIMPLVAPGEVLVVQTIGAEKLRYLTGSSVAFIRREDGTVNICTLDLCDIYAIAREAFDLPKEADITACEY